MRICGKRICETRNENRRKKTEPRRTGDTESRERKRNDSCRDRNKLCTVEFLLLPYWWFLQSTILTTRISTILINDSYYIWLPNSLSMVTLLMILATYGYLFIFFAMVSLLMILAMLTILMILAMLTLLMILAMVVSAKERWGWLVLRQSRNSSSRL